MKLKKIILPFLILPLAVTACNDFLDVVPDSRTDLDTPDKIAKLLASAYPDRSYILLTEMASDNTDSWNILTLQSMNKTQEDMWSWTDVVEDMGNDSPEQFWSASYSAISAANLALEAIEKLGNPESLNPQIGEALVARAYNHFCLVNVFAKHYSTKTGKTDLGIPYVTKSENTVDVDLQRQSVAEVYALIEKDLLKGMPLIDNTVYVVPKYHFNLKAAQAFAARYYLYKGDWDKVIEYTTKVLGEDPRAMLRDWSPFPGLPSGQPRAQLYAQMEHNANIFISCPISAVYSLGNYSTGKKFSHSQLIALAETTKSAVPWCPKSSSTGEYYFPENFYKNPASNYVGSSGRFVATMKHPYYFQYTDPIARTGYAHTQIVIYSSEELLLARAEAYVMKGDYDKALNDLNLWITTTSTGTSISRELVNEYYSTQKEYVFDDPTPRKKLSPETPFASAEQENFIQCVLQMRRIETIHDGIRWFDIKRYGIEIVRRVLDDNNRPTLLDNLKVDDPRRAIQLPSAVINAGLLPNPRVF
ncbi:MAG: RagB/SusD family nutrient uptake outer membrane protein [Alistipes sp.]|jgi:tetratricopeptide (TPR) repeat protein|nr:RagB/SusD family nutrient uptake outer membrane protein [Alistipes sp.]